METENLIREFRGSLLPSINTEDLEKILIQISEKFPAEYFYNLADLMRDFIHERERLIAYLDDTMLILENNKM